MLAFSKLVEILMYLHNLIDGGKTGEIARFTSASNFGQTAQS